MCLETLTHRKNSSKLKLYQAGKNDLRHTYHVKTGVMAMRVPVSAGSL